VDHRETVHIPGGAGDRVEGAVDERIELGRLRRAAARGERNSGGGASEAGLCRVEELEKRMGKLLVKRI
jgi:hypothetical protein